MRLAKDRVVPESRFQELSRVDSMTTSLLAKSYGDYTATNTIDLHDLEAIQDTYTAHFRDFAQFVRAEDLDVDYESIREYFIQLNHSHYAAGTKRIKRQAVKKRILQASQDWLIDDRIRLKELLSDLDHFGETKAPKIASHAVKRDKVFTDQEIRLLISYSTERLSLLINFLWTTGCRVNEMTTLTLGRCKVDADKVTCTVIGKGNKERKVYISTTFYGQIRDYFRGEEFLFETQSGKPYANNYVSDRIREKSRKYLGRIVSGTHSQHGRSGRPGT
jgi:site-specific recombinase XerD